LRAYRSHIRNSQVTGGWYRCNWSKFTRKNAVLDQPLDLRLEAPVALPVGHRLTILEVLCEMVHALVPRIHVEVAEAAARAHVRDRDFPCVHGGGGELAVVHEPEVLPDMVSAVEGTFFVGALETARVVVDFEMGIAWIFYAAEDTCWRAVCLSRYATPIGSTNPSFKGEVE